MIRNAISLVFKSAEKVFVVRRSSSKPSYPGAWSIPSTYVHDGEDVAHAAKRLVQNKLGLSDVTLGSIIGVSPIVNRGTHELQMTDILVDSSVGEFVLNLDEYTESRWVTVKELAELIERENGGQMGECTKTLLKSEGLLPQ